MDSDGNTEVLVVACEDEIAVLSKVFVTLIVVGRESRVWVTPATGETEAFEGTVEGAALEPLL